MPEKNSTTPRRAADDESAVKSTGTAPRATAEAGPAKQEARPEATAAAPVATPVGTKSAAVRLLTRPVAGKKMVAAKGQSQRVADAAKPSQKPQAGGGRRGPRRGASKGR